jgi:hypothetical protein
MAPREEGGVVGSDLRVYGVQGLRVCDASVFPWIVSGHTVRCVFLFEVSVLMAVSNLRRVRAMRLGKSWPMR